MRFEGWLKDKQTSKQTLKSKPNLRQKYIYGYFLDNNIRKENVNFLRLKETIKYTFGIASGILQMTLIDIFIIIKRNIYAVTNGPLQSSRRQVLLFKNLSLLRSTPVRIDKNKALQVDVSLHQLKKRV